MRKHIWIGRLYLEFEIRGTSYFTCMMGSSFFSIKLIGVERFFRWMFDLFLTFGYAGCKQFSIGGMLLGFKITVMYYYGSKKKKESKNGR